MQDCSTKKRVKDNVAKMKTVSNVVVKAKKKKRMYYIIERV